MQCPHHHLGLVCPCSALLLFFGLPPFFVQVTTQYIKQVHKRAPLVVRCWESLEAVSHALKVPLFQIRSALDGRKKSTLGFR